MDRCTPIISGMPWLRLGARRALALAALVVAMLVLALLPVSRGDAATRNVNVGQKYDGSAAFLFNPSIQSAVVGDTVHFAWFNGIHFIKSYDESPPGTPVWQGGFSMAGDSLDHTFTVPGVYTYYCSLHASRSQADPATIDATLSAQLPPMVGKIIVSSAVGGVSEQVDPSTLAVEERDSSGPQWVYYAGGAVIVLVLSSVSLMLRSRRRRIEE